MKKIIAYLICVCILGTTMSLSVTFSYAEDETIVNNNEVDLDEERNINDTNIDGLVPGRDYVPNEIIVKYDADINTESLEEIIEINDYSIDQVVESDNGMVNLDDLTGSNQIEISSGLYVLSFDESDLVSNVIEEISKFESIIYAQPNYIYKTCDVEPIECIDESEPKGPLSQQAMINSLNIGDNTKTGNGVVVAVIDTGIDLSHPALAGSLWSKNGVYGYDTNNNNSPITMAQDDIYTSEHGTHVAGIIAMQNVGEYQCKGIATGAKIMDLQASTSENNFKTSSIINALQIAEENNADIVNMSLGGKEYDHALCAACYKASRSMVLIAAAGNDGLNKQESYPAAFPSVIGVMAYGGSHKVDDYPEQIQQNIISNNSFLNINYPSSGLMTMAKFSNFDSREKYYNIIAPGVNICSTKAGGRGATNGYVYLSGTSMASPIVAATAALYIENHQTATPGQIRFALKNTNKYAKLFDCVNKNDELLLDDEKLLPQIDINTILSTPLNTDVDGLFHSNDTEYTGLIEIIKSQYPTIFSQSYNLTNEDVNLLSTLRISGSALIDCNMLSNIPNLMYLEVSGSALNGEVLNRIICNNSFDNLETFFIHDAKILECMFNNSFAPDLKYLQINSCMAMNMIKGLNNFENLYRIQIYNTALSDLSSFSNLSQLKVLVLSDNKIVDLSPLSSLNHLKALNINNNYVASLDPINCLQELVVIYASNNLVSSLNGILSLPELTFLWVENNPLYNYDENINSFLNSKEILNSKLFSFIYKPYKYVYIPVEKIECADVSVNRGDLPYKPEVAVYPYDATYANNINLTCNNNYLISETASGVLKYNENYNYNNNQTYESTITCECDNEEDVFNVKLIMPTIESLHIENYSFGQETEKIISVLTTIDTTKIKVESNNNCIEYSEKDFMICKDFGNERIIKLAFDPTFNNTSISVSTGDALGYFDQKLLSSNIIINVSNGMVQSLNGSTDFLLLNNNSIQGISSNAIGSNCSISTLVLDTNINIMNASAFNSCNIDELYITGNNLSIQNNIFNNCNNMSAYISHDYVTSSLSNAIIISDFQYANNKLTGYFGDDENIIIPKYLGIKKIGTLNLSSSIKENIKTIDLTSINEIEDQAFNNCINLSSIENSSSVSIVGENAFENTKIQSLNISVDSITNVDIKENAFLGCANLEYVNINNKDSLSLKKSCFNNCSSLKLINWNTTNNISLYESAFENCVHLVKINFDNLFLQGKSIFSGCEKLTGDIVIKNNSSIYDETFFNCKELNSILFINCFNLGSKVFSGATDLNELAFITKLDNNNYKPVYVRQDSFDNYNNAVIYCNENTLLMTENNDPLNFSFLNEDFEIGLYYSNPTLNSYNGDSTTVIIPDVLHIYSIKSRSFYRNQVLKTLTISDSVEIIDDEAFYWNTELTSVSGGSHVTMIGDSAFLYCRKLKDISTFSSLRTIDEYAFCWTGIERYKMPNSISQCKECAFLCCEQLIDIELSGLLVQVSDGCFGACNNLERCVLKYHITRIGEEAFFDCDNLKHLYIPKSVEAIRNNAFPSNVIIFCESTFSLKTQISRRFGNTVIPNYEVVDGTLLEYQSLTGYDYEDINQNKVIEVPNVVEEISEYMFYNNQIATKVILSDYLDVIQSRAFMFCNHIKTILMPSTMSYIGSNAFNKATMLEEITIPEGIETIKSNTFFQTRIKGCRIPDSVTEIESGAFWHCTQLKSVFIPDSVTSIANNAFADCNSYLILFGRNNSILPNYVNTNCDNNGNYTLKLKLGFEISDNALESYIGSEVNVQVPFGIGLQSISDEAFKNNTVIESVSIASEITEIGNECFSGCTSLSKIVIPDDLTTIGTDAFYGITNLTVYCNDNSDIEDYCMTNNISVITDYELENGVLKCYNGNNISVFIPEDLCIIEVGQGAFYCSPNRSLIQSVTIPTDVLVISNNAFLLCSSISTISLPSTLKRCGIFAFSGCTGLTSINIPSSLEEIDAYAFYNCSNLSSIDLSNVVSISYNAFDNCSFLESATFSNVTESIGNNAFKDCDDLVFYCVLNSYAYNYAVNNNISYEIIQSRSIPLQHIERFTNESNNEIENELSNDVFNLERYIRETYNGDLSENDIIDIIEHIR